MKNRFIKKNMLSITLILSFTVVILAITAIYTYIEYANNNRIKPVIDLGQADAIVVFGALVYSDDMVSEVVAKRLDIAIETYYAGKADKIIVSGDHGRPDYDEVAAMKNYLINKDIPQDNIFLDHAGFNTYDSIYRAKEIFTVEKVILATQEIHLKRALFIAQCLGVEAEGVVALPYTSEITIQRIREIGARGKAFFQAAIIKPKPRFLGEPIPVSSNSGTVTDDKL